MNLRKKIFILMIIFPAFPSLPVAAQTAQEQIREAVVDFLWGQYPEESPENSAIKLSVTPVDQRLRLSPCPDPLQTSLSQNQRPVGRVSVRVECLGEAPWSLYVPAQIQVSKAVVVAARNLPRGSVISADDLSLTETDISLMRSSYLLDPEQVIGMQVKRNIRAASPVNLLSLQAPKIVKKGDLVAIIAENGKIRIQMNGVAMEDGAKNEQIKVKNNSSKRIIQGQVSAPGKVSINY